MTWLTQTVAAEALASLPGHLPQDFATLVTDQPSIQVRPAPEREEGDRVVLHTRHGGDQLGAGQPPVTAGHLDTSGSGGSTPTPRMTAPGLMAGPTDVAV